MKPLIRISNLVNQFGTHRVHDGMNLEIYQGQITAIVGGSGTGKSVLVKSILGLRKPTSGHIFVQDRDITTMDHQELLDIQQLWGVLFQNGALFSSLTVVQNVMLPMEEFTSLSSSDANELAEMKLALVGLPPEASQKYPSELSGGMVKRVALARALALDPSILFLDEPTAGLDPISAADFDTLIDELAESLNLAVVMITHDLDSLTTICDRIAVIVDKRIVAGTLEELLVHPHPWIQEYFHGTRARAAMNKAV